MTKSVKPAEIAQVAIVESVVLGVVAHHAQCLVPGCVERSAAMDPRSDGKPHGTVVRWAERHGEKHVAAAEKED